MLEAYRWAHVRCAGSLHMPWPSVPLAGLVLGVLAKTRDYRRQAAAHELQQALRADRVMRQAVEVGRSDFSLRTLLPSLRHVFVMRYHRRPDPLGVLRGPYVIDLGADDVDAAAYPLHLEARRQAVADLQVRPLHVPDRLQHPLLAFGHLD